MSAKYILCIVLLIGLTAASDSNNVVDFIERCFRPDTAPEAVGAPMPHRSHHHIRPWLNNSNCRTWRRELGERKYVHIVSTLSLTGFISPDKLTRIERSSEASLASDSMVAAPAASSDSSATTATSSSISDLLGNSTDTTDTTTSGTSLDDTTPNTATGSELGDVMSAGIDQPSASETAGAGAGMAVGPDDTTDGDGFSDPDDQNQVGEKGEGESEGEGHHGDHHWHHHLKNKKKNDLFYFPDLMPDDHKRPHHHAPKPKPKPKHHWGDPEEGDYTSALYAQFRQKMQTNKGMSSVRARQQQQEQEDRVATYRRHHHHRRAAGQLHQVDPTLWPNANVYFTFATKSGSHKTTGGATLATTPVEVRQQAKAVQAMLAWEEATCLSFEYVDETSTGNGVLLVSGARSDSNRECAVDADGFPGTGNTNVLYLAGATVDDASIESNLDDMNEISDHKHDSDHDPWFSSESSETIDVLDAGCPCGVILHALGHVAGLEHTAQRQDRDTYVTIAAASDLGVFASQYNKLATAPATEEAIPGTLAGASALAQSQAQFVNFYGSVMTYAADDYMQPLITEEALRDSAEFISQVTNMMGQRTVIGLLDKAEINQAYGCQPLNLQTSEGTNLAGYFHPGQTVLQVLRKIHRRLLTEHATSNVAFDQIRLYRDSVSAENEVTSLTDTLATVVGSDTNVVFTFDLLQDTVKIIIATHHSVRVHVDFSWTVARLRANLQAYYNVPSTGLVDGTTSLSDTETLSSAGVTSSSVLTALGTPPMVTTGDESSTGSVTSDSTDSTTASSDSSDSSVDTSTGAITIDQLLNGLESTGSNVNLDNLNFRKHQRHTRTHHHRRHHQDTSTGGVIDTTSTDTTTTTDATSTTATTTDTTSTDTTTTAGSVPTDSSATTTGGSGTSPSTTTTAGASVPWCYVTGRRSTTAISSSPCGELTTTIIPKGGRVLAAGVPETCATDSSSWFHVAFDGTTGFIPATDAQPCCDGFGPRDTSCYKSHHTLNLTSEACGGDTLIQVPRGFIVHDATEGTEDATVCDEQNGAVYLKVTYQSQVGYVLKTDLMPHSCGNITAEEVMEIMTGASCALSRRYLPHLNYAMTNGGIITPLRQAAFLAQLGHESGSFRYMEELADGSAYEGRHDLGNTQPGDGRRYKGRGPIQITGRSNYRAAGAALGLDLENNPTWAARETVGFRLAAWYWNTHHLNARADTGTQADFDRITRAINGGTNGKQDRDTRWRHAKQVLDAP